MKLRMQSLMRMNEGRWLNVLFGSLLAATGCTESVDSDAIRTRGIHAAFEALATGDGSTGVSAVLRVGGDDGTFVNLVHDDQLIAQMSKSQRALAKKGDGYSTKFAEDKAGTEIHIAFRRGKDDDGAPDSFAILPADFSPEVTASSIARGDRVTIAWGKKDPGTVIHWKLDGDCIFPDSGSTADTGQLVLDAANIDAKSSTEKETCEVAVTLDRVASGTVDPGFGEGGDFRAIQRRSVTFSSLPAGAVPPHPVPDAGDASAPVADSGAADAAVTPDAAVIPDAAVTPDAAAQPDAAVVPDAAVTPDAAVGPDSAVIPDAAVTPDASPNDSGADASSAT
jgi:hypothetical protein